MAKGGLLGMFCEILDHTHIADSHSAWSALLVVRKLRFSPKGVCVCVLLCFIIPILGNRYGPGVNSLRQ